MTRLSHLGDSRSLARPQSHAQGDKVDIILQKAEMTLGYTPTHWEREKLLPSALIWIRLRA